jgi:hypothetical protein
MNRWFGLNAVIDSALPLKDPENYWMAGIKREGVDKQ